VKHGEFNFSGLPGYIRAGSTASHGAAPGSVDVHSKFPQTTMTRSYILLSAVLLGACGGPARPADTPEPAPGAVAISALEAPPVHALIGHREALSLDSEQITALDSIGQHVHAENQARMRRLADHRGELRTGRDARPGEVVPATDTARVILESIQSLNREAKESVRELLTAEQRTRTCELFRDRDRHRMRSADAARRPPTRGAVERPGAVVRTPIWPWCAEQAPEVEPSEASG
jgi:hypothetical protein